MLTGEFPHDLSAFLVQANRYGIVLEAEKGGRLADVRMVNDDDRGKKDGLFLVAVFYGTWSVLWNDKPDFQRGNWDFDGRFILLGAGGKGEQGS